MTHHSSISNVTNIDLGEIDEGIHGYMPYLTHNYDVQICRPSRFGTLGMGHVE